MLPPKLALFLAFAGAFYALRKDQKWHPVGGSLWLPLLWILRCGSRDIGRWFVGGDVEEIGDVGLYDPLFFTAAILIGLFILMRRRVDWGQVIRSNFWLFLFFAFLLLSVSWSALGYYSFKRWVRAFGDLEMALIIATSPAPLESLTALLRRCSYFLVPLSIVLIRYFPDYGKGLSKHWNADPWIGVATHKNTLGQLSLVAALAFLWTAFEFRRDQSLEGKERRLKWYILGAYGAMTLYLLHAGSHSQSSTSIMALCSAVIVFWALGRWQLQPIKFKRQFIAIAITVVVLNVGMEVVLDQSIRATILELQGKRADLTGRTILWEDCLAIGKRHLWLGAGYGAFWTPEVRVEIKVRNRNGPTEAHNGYIETFLNVGLVGVALFIPVIVSALRGAWRMCTLHFTHGRVRLTLLLATLVHNYAESGFPRPTHLIWFLFMLAAVNTWHGIPDIDDSEAEPDFIEAETVEAGASEHD